MSVTRIANPYGGGGIRRSAPPAVDEPLLPSQSAPVSPIKSLLEPMSREPTVAEALAAVRQALIDVEKASPERDELLAQVIALGDRVEHFFGSLKAERRGSLETQLAECQQQGRRALDELQAARAKANQLQGRWNAQEESASKARASLLSARQSKPAAESWPTNAEIAAWRLRVSEAESDAERWRVAQSEMQREIDIANGEVATLSRRLHALTAKRQDIEAELAGKPRRGPFGLEITPPAD